MQFVKNFAQDLSRGITEAPALQNIIEVLTIFMQPIFEAASDKSVLSAYWQAGGPWSVDH